MPALAPTSLPLQASFSYCLLARLRGEEEFPVKFEAMQHDKREDESCSCVDGYLSRWLVVRYVDYRRI